MSVFDSIERSESEKISKILNENNWDNTVLISQCNKIYYNYLEKYNNARMKMSPVDKLAFERRLYTMAKREIFPYGNEYSRPAAENVETAYGGVDVGSLRIRARKQEEES